MADRVGQPFKNEKEYSDFITNNIDELCLSFFGETVKKKIKEWYLCSFRKFGGNKPRIDLMVELESGKRVGIEIKCPKQPYHELSRAISQILSYGVLAELNEKPIDEMVIITNLYDDILGKVINKYNLPIRVFYVTRETYGEYC